MPSSSDRRVLRLASAAAVAFALCAAPRLAAAQGEVFGGEDLTSPPKLLSAAATARLVARSFPEDLRASGKGGTVNLQFVIGKDGKVEPTSIEVIDAPAPAFGSAAKTVVEKMQFVPGKKDGSAVRSRVQLPIVYKP
jgi:protein TonB